MSLLQELKWSLQALALPTAAQRDLFPDFVCVADELALDFDAWFAAASGQGGLSAGQHAALSGVNNLLSEMSGASRSDHWTVPALEADPFWQDARRRAKLALDAFG